MNISRKHLESCKASVVVATEMAAADPLRYRHLGLGSLPCEALLDGRLLMGAAVGGGDEASVLHHGANNVMRMSSLVRWRGCWSRRLGGDPPVAGSLGDRAGGTDPQLVWPGCGRRWSLGALLQRVRLKRHAKLRCGSGRGTSAVVLWLHHQRGGKGAQMA